jgi:hypothetical protein
VFVFASQSTLHMPITLSLCVHFVLDLTILDFVSIDLLAHWLWRFTLVSSAFKFCIWTKFVLKMLSIISHYSIVGKTSFCIKLINPGGVTGMRCVETFPTRMHTILLCCYTPWHRTTRAQILVVLKCFIMIYCADLREYRVDLFRDKQLCLLWCLASIVLEWRNVFQDKLSPTSFRTLTIVEVIDVVYCINNYYLAAWLMTCLEYSELLVLPVHSVHLYLLWRSYVWVSLFAHLCTSFYFCETIIVVCQNVISAAPNVQTLSHITNMLRLEITAIALLLRREHYMPYSRLNYVTLRKAV